MTRSLDATNPAAAATANGVQGLDASSNQPKAVRNTESPLVNKASLAVMVGERCLTLSGRVAQTMALLIDRGASGFTAGEASPLGWARRTSAYVRNLRLYGVPIVTTWERVGDARVGRYSLAGPVRVVEGGEE